MTMLKRLLTGQYAVFWQVLLAGFILFGIFVLYEQNVFKNIYELILNFLSLVFSLGIAYLDYFMASVIEEYDKHGLFSAIFFFTLVMFFVFLVPLFVITRLLSAVLELLIYKISGKYRDIDLFSSFFLWVAIISLSYYFVNETDLKQTLGLKNLTYIWGIIIGAIVFTVLAKLIYEKIETKFNKID